VAVSNVELRVDARNAVNALNKVNQKTNLLTSSVAKLGIRLAQLETARRFFKGFREADSAAAAVETLGVNSRKLKKELLGVTAEIEGLQSQTQLLAASYDVASAGFNDAASAAKILKAASLGATGGLSDLNTVADATTSVLNAYGLSSDKAAKLVDGFIQTQNDGKIVVAQYASQIGRVAPIAAAAGVGIEELNAAISTVTATGVPVESTFAGLRQVIASIIKPTDEAQKVSEALGLQFNSAAIKAKGFGGFLEDVVEKTGGSEVALTKLFGSVEAVAAILPLTNDGLVSFNKNLQNQATSAGAAELAAKTLGGTVTNQIQAIVNDVGTLARQLDEVLGPVIKGLFTEVKKLTGEFVKLFALIQNAPSALEVLKGNLASFFGAQSQAVDNLVSAVNMLDISTVKTEEDANQLESSINRISNSLISLRKNTPRELLEARGLSGDVDQIIDRLGTLRKELRVIRESGLDTGPADSDTTKPKSPLQAQIDALLEQLNQKTTNKAQAEQQRLSFLKQINAEINRINDAELDGLEAGRQIVEQIDAQGAAEIKRGETNLALLQAKIDGRLEEEQLAQKIKAIEESNLNDVQKKKQIAIVKQTAALEKQIEATEKLDQVYRSIGSAVSDGIVNALTAAVEGTKSLADVASQTLRQVANILLQFGVNTALGGIPGLGKFFGGARASGGTVTGGRSYMVGEKGPELFTPGRTGSIAPSGSFGGANVVVNVDASGSQAQGNQPNAKALGSAIGAAVQAELIKQKRPGGLLA
tara:strand:+ start:1880 stop:4165 length:2286 start_codon:yes stop_codon:yes gene_type:complete